MQWYCAKNKKRFGPYTSAQLKQLVQSGQLSAADHVANAAEGPWHPASSVRGLFPEVPKQAAPPPPPAAFAMQPQMAYAPPPQAQQVPAAIPAAASRGIRCNVCGQGSMEKRKKYRLSGPAVVIGWLFLIPSFLGMAFGVLGLFAAGGASSSAADRVQREYERDLRKANISDEQVAKRLRGEQLLPSETSVLTTTQRRQLDLAEMGHGAALVGTAAGVGIAGGASIFMIVMSFCGGLLGWILTMKKRVLQCTSCEAVVAAS